MKNIVITGGGTAGHAWPVIAVGNVLKKNNRVKLMYVGSRNGMERELAEKNEIPYHGIFAGKRRNYISLSNFFDLFKIFFGLVQSYFLLKSFRPEVIFAKGGYVTFPIVYWAKKLKIPLIVHESDIIMGRANIYAAGFARKVCINYPLDIFQKENPKLQVNLYKFIYTGLPLRKDFFEGGETETEPPSILITGGSQGSSKINTLISEILPQLILKYQIYHISGKRDFEMLNKFKNPNYHLYQFTDNISEIMKKSSLIITRSGANTLAEISALKKCAILIPLESAAMDHQNANARVYENKNAAVVVSEKNLTQNSLLSIINRLMEEEKLRKLIGHHAGEFVKPDAVSEIVELLFEKYDGK